MKKTRVVKMTRAQAKKIEKGLKEITDNLIKMTEQRPVKKTSVLYDETFRDDLRGMITCLKLFTPKTPEVRLMKKMFALTIQSLFDQQTGKASTHAESLKKMVDNFS